MLNAASLRSDNPIQLPFPYAGAQHGTFSLFSGSGQFPSVVAFTIERGQILCADRCDVRISFNEKDSQARTFVARSSADHDSTAIYFEDPEALFEAVHAANTFTISVLMYEAGIKRFYFTTAGIRAIHLAR